LIETPILNYGRHTIDQDDIDAVVSVLQGELITQGPVVEKFENALAEKVGAKYAIAVTSGTAGLHLACLAANVKPGSLGLTSALTFVASANAMYYSGMNVGLCDIDQDTLCMSPGSLHTALNKYPEAKIIIPVHFAGLAAHSEAIRDIAGKRVIIEDASHSLGGKYACGRQIGCGAYADMTVFSFHPVKPITTGEGGAIVTNNAEFAHRIRALRTHGIERDANLFENKNEAHENGELCTWYYEQQHLGFNYRMTDIQAALGLSQLKKLDHFLSRRRKIASRYDAAFTDLKNISRPQLTTKYSEQSGHHIYVVEFDLIKLSLSRVKIIAKLKSRNIGSQVHYIPIYKQPYHAKKLGQIEDNFPITEKYYQGCLSIPLYPGMSNQDVENVIHAITEVSNLN
jgi:perosamine synthetase